MKEFNKLLKLLISYTEKLYNINSSIKMNTKDYVSFLLNMLMKKKANLFYKDECKYKIKLFQS